MHIDDLLRMLVAKEASDLHIRAGEPPIMSNLDTAQHQLSPAAKAMHVKTVTDTKLRCHEK